MLGPFLSYLIKIQEFSQIDKIVSSLLKIRFIPNVTVQ
jgi:hypothetical protein